MLYYFFLNGYIVAKNLLFCSDNCRAIDCNRGWWFQVQGGDIGPLRHSLLSWTLPYTNTNAFGWKPQHPFFVIKKKKRPGCPW